MTNYIQIDSIKNNQWKNFANQIDSKAPDKNNPNEVGDYGDKKLSPRELKRLEQMIAEYYNSNPEKNALGENIPTGSLVSKAMTDIMGGTWKYFKFQIEQAAKNLKQKFSSIFKS